MQAIIDCKFVTSNTGNLYVASLKFKNFDASETCDTFIADKSRLKALAKINLYATKEGFAYSRRDARTLYRNIDK